MKPSLIVALMCIVLVATLPGLAVHLGFVSGNSVAQGLPVSEAPTGFDNQTNGMVDPCITLVVFVSTFAYTPTMDVEKTIEFILATEARTEARLDRLAERQDQFANDLAKLSGDLARLAGVVRDVAVTVSETGVMVSETAVMISQTNDSVRRLERNSLQLKEDAAQLREYSETRWHLLEEMFAKNRKDLEELRQALERHLPKDQSS